MAEIFVNARGLQCPGPIVQLFKAIQNCNPGDVVVVEATDPGFRNDVEAWCRRTGHRLVSIEDKDGAIVARVIKAS